MRYNAAHGAQIIDLNETRAELRFYAVTDTTQPTQVPAPLLLLLGGHMAARAWHACYCSRARRTCLLLPFSRLWPASSCPTPRGC